MDTDRALGIYIKGVSEETTEVDLQSTFSQFGAITETVIKGSMPRGCFRGRRAQCVMQGVSFGCAVPALALPSFDELDRAIGDMRSMRRRTLRAF